VNGEKLKHMETVLKSFITLLWFTAIRCTFLEDLTAQTFSWNIDSV
jgi:hypothetical protein